MELFWSEWQRRNGAALCGPNPHHAAGRIAFVFRGCIVGDPALVNAMLEKGDTVVAPLGLAPVGFGLPCRYPPVEQRRRNPMHVIHALRFCDSEVVFGEEDQELLFQRAELRLRRGETLGVV